MYELREVRLDGLAFGGDAVGRDDSGRVVFVAGGAPGDRVEVRITESKKAWARGDLLRVIEAGARVTPPCPVQPQCGGCPWMHVEVKAQLAAKQEIVRRALERSGAEVEEILAAQDWLGYRVRAKMTARAGAVGFQARKSHRVVDVEHCAALDPRLDLAFQAARAELRTSLGDGGTIAGLVAADGRVHLHAECGYLGAPETLADHAASLLGQAGIVGIGVRSADGASTSRYYGEPRIDLGGGLMASSAGFAQANATQNEILRRIVLRWALGDDEPQRVLELYAGDGNFTRDLVKRVRVVAVEGDRDASARLVDNLRAIAPRTHENVAQWAVRAEPSETAVAKLAAASEQFDVVLMDPPRAGAADVLDGVAMLGARRIVYVSCDPMTLARDLMRLGDLGYRSVRARPIDMMPHTSHIEVVCLLERKPRETDPKSATS
jgi:23S rRNA (uracil1939-C5)-methyltransferase